MYTHKTPQTVNSAARLHFRHITEGGAISRISANMSPPANVNTSHLTVSRLKGTVVKKDVQCYNPLLLIDDLFGLVLCVAIFLINLHNVLIILLYLAQLSDPA
jgi:hypothetical protein